MINCWDALEVMQTNSPLNESTPAPDSPAVASAPALPLKTGPILKIFGVGGAGCNALAHIARAGIDGVECVAMNTDAAALERCPVANKLSLGTKLTRGLGAGGDPDRGRAAAEEDRERLRPMCEGMDVLFVVAGLGGGTGTGAAPVLAQMAKESGALVIGMVVLPFDWEGERRQRQAELGLRQLKAAGFLLVVTTNQPELSRSHLNRREMDRMQLESPWLRTGHHDMVLPDLAAAAQWIGEVISPVPQPLAKCG